MKIKCCKDCVVPKRYPGKENPGHEVTFKVQ